MLRTVSAELNGRSAIRAGQRENTFITFDFNSGKFSVVRRSGSSAAQGTPCGQAPVPSSGGSAAGGSAAPQPGTGGGSCGGSTGAECGALEREASRAAPSVDCAPAASLAGTPYLGGLKS